VSDAMILILIFAWGGGLALLALVPSARRRREPQQDMATQGQALLPTSGQLGTTLLLVFAICGIHIWALAARDLSWVGLLAGLALIGAVLAAAYTLQRPHQP